FWANQRDPQNCQSFQVLVDETVIGSFQPRGVYLHYSASFTVSGGMHTIKFTGLSPHDNVVFIDDVHIATDKERTFLNGHVNEISCLAFSSDSQTLATGSKDGVVNVWEVATGKKLVTVRGGAVDGLALSADGSILAVGG